ncbi:SGNH/GDSL hydrolase family protein [Homoserinimonas hongtaonis]|uniref:SGNH/GDSL hydrolase family protein n=1 Tax=Homoserinimonas hongtaonis TaxID=2079791 RepID=A0A2U1T3B1_9MICO|nr:SGNH/GDSL hydrolase family protein [Salinibacterium hongtaonis]AWB90591.1 SGNH hydrolase [Salinibacterium hongtaonis]PWB98372.1 SGNH/GDSL hydrolase family protein [Salinibacterium hongtaonis]
MTPQHPWTRYVALGDSFTEGIGDPEPGSPGGNRGWADRVAETLALGTENFSYANLAIRGRLLQQIVDEQVEPALELKPDLVSLSAGGNDIIRPNTDPDEVAARLELAVERLRRDGAAIVLFTGPDIGMTPVMKRIRGKVAIFNENVRAVAHRHDAVVVDMWALSELRDPRMWDADRLHFSPVGHQTIAMAVLDALGVPHELEPFTAEPLPVRPWRTARADDIVWAREYFVPWVVRRIRHRSSGDGITAKRPGFDA